ncbi:MULTISPECIES: DsbC family protein [Candidatus Ichthyocystis]|uniref:DsbC family protein n=1 Tax=Candidatus Ichthyocystis TaxID=2929841 RepID=UPI000AF906AA|nr:MULTISPECIES: DsbC family protein [Ichthyocystis]
MMLRARQRLFWACLLLYTNVFASAVHSNSNIASKVTEDIKNKAIDIAVSVFPSVSVDAVLPSSMPGWVVVASGDQIIYVNVKLHLIFQGTLIDEKSRVNLTDKVKTSIMANAIKNFPFEKNAIPYVSGNGSRHIVVFEDPYCKYCRVFTEEISTLTNATVYVVLYPVVKEQSMVVAAKIWCAPDRAKAWHDWIVDSKEPNNSGSCNTPLRKNVEMGRKYSVTGTPTTFFMTGQRISGAPTVDTIEELLGN